MMLAFVALGVLVFASLSAYAHNTFPHTNERYSPEGRVLSWQIIVPNVEYHATVNPNGTAGFYLPAGTPRGTGAFLRLLARWKAERGSSIRVLELFTNSRSLVSTVMTAAVLGGFGFIECVLVVLWCLSPLSGQASLRVSSEGTLPDI
ncbi:hypothetical protein BDZ45DRAFT_400343 [Acephala macrosclerotiorum]|nr:hypothetical protein BDZ45DRAFT_400343 [Acephala macrosclerotiorum]